MKCCIFEWIKNLVSKHLTRLFCTSTWSHKGHNFSCLRTTNLYFSLMPGIIGSLWYNYIWNQVWPPPTAVRDRGCSSESVWQHDPPLIFKGLTLPQACSHMCTRLFLMPQYWFMLLYLTTKTASVSSSWKCTLRPVWIQQTQTSQPTLQRLWYENEVRVKLSGYIILDLRVCLLCHCPFDLSFCVMVQLRTSVYLQPSKRMSRRGANPGLN